MITAQQIQEILSLYAKFGWTLRRVLLTPKLKKNLGDSIQDIFANADISESKIDAVWFSRDPANNKESWELRRLSETPYALFEVFEIGEDEKICEEVRKEMEARLLEKS